MHDSLRAAQPLGDLSAYEGVRAFDLVVNSFAYIVQQRGGLGYIDVGPDLGCDGSSDAGGFDGVVCGHIHDCAGQRAMLGATPVVNAGPEGIWWELPL